MITSPANRLNRDIQRQVALSNDIARTQVEIATGKKILKPSDAPVDSARIASLQRQSSDEAAWQSNLDLGIARNNQADSVVRVASDRLARARELLVSATSGSASASDRVTFAAEMLSLADEIDGLAATTAPNGEPLFSSSALRMRFSSSDLFAPVPSAAEAFDSGGIATVLRNAATAIGSGNVAGMNTSLGALDTAISRTADVSADIGTRGARMANIQERLTNEGIDRAAERSALEDTDLNEAIARLNQQMLTLDAARAAFARINRETLFDLLS